MHGGKENNFRYDYAYRTYFPYPDIIILLFLKVMVFESFDNINTRLQFAGIDFMRSFAAIYLLCYNQLPCCNC